MTLYAMTLGKSAAGPSKTYFTTRAEAEAVAADLNQCERDAQDYGDAWSYTVEPSPDGTAWQIAIREADGYLVGIW